MAQSVLRLPGGTNETAVKDLYRALGRLIDGTARQSIQPVAPGEAATSPPPPSAQGLPSVDGPPSRETDGPTFAGGLRATHRGWLGDSPGVLLETSGSTTGRGQLVDLCAEALVASAQATHERLGGPGRWIVCLPVHHIAGLQVLVRSHVAGTEPVIVDTTAGFRPDALARAVDQLAAAPGYVSLVPTQLARVLRAGPGVVAPLRELRAILIGGAATSPHLLAAAREAGLRVVTTYGMTETGGGCVYDGKPLRGVEVEVDTDGRVWLGGVTLARGYVNDPEATKAAFSPRGDQVWLRTSDRGRWNDNRLQIVGRLDDVLISGGSNVPAGEVAHAIAELGVAEVVVVGVADEEWGQLVTAVVAGPTPPLFEIRTHVAARLGAHCAPRALVRLDQLPLRSLGKPDRHAATRVAEYALRGGSGEPPDDVAITSVERH